MQLYIFIMYVVIVIHVLSFDFIYITLIHLADTKWINVM